MYKIKKRVFLYGLLMFSVLAQVILMKRVAWFPDIILLMVVFAGIFRGGIEAAVLGLVAGLLRGLFSPETLPIDIFIFPAVGVISSVMTRMFYRQNPAAQIFTTTIAVTLVVALQTLYLNATSGSDIGVHIVLLKSWKPIVVTVVISPFVFTFLKELLRLEE
ncbi:MAG: rod shape-determining protein MreD [Candidatus Omnitrophota bacterium]